MFISGFHRLAFFFFLGCAAVWFYVLKEWAGIVVALIGFLPLALVSSLVPAMLLGTLRQMHVPDAALSWLPIVGGAAVVAHAILAQERTALALETLAGAGLIVGGVSMLQLRLNAMRLKAATGMADPDDLAFLDELDEAAGRRTEPWTP